MSNGVFLGLSAIERVIRGTSDTSTLRVFRRHCERFAEAIRTRLTDLREEFFPIDNELQFYSACGVPISTFRCTKHSELAEAIASYEGLLEYAEALLLKIDSVVAEQAVPSKLNDGYLELVKCIHPTMAAAILPFVRPRQTAVNDPHASPDAA